MSFLFSQPAPGIVPIDSISFAELAKVDASSVLGNPSGSLADASSITFQDLTQNNLTLFSDTEQGLVPASGGGTSTFLRADGSWATAGISTAGALDQQVLAYDSGTGLTTWQYAGLGDGSFGTGNVILGRAKPASLVGTDNTILGQGSATALTTGSNNIVVGKGNGTTLTTGSNNVLIGNDSGTATRSGIIAIGDAVAIAQTGDYGVFLGQYCGAYGNGNTSIAIGYRTASSLGNSTSPWSNSIYLGNHTGYNAGTGSIGIGYSATSSSYDDYAVAIGYSALGGGDWANPNDYTVAIGYQAGYEARAQNSVLLGRFAGSRAGAGGLVQQKFYLNGTTTRPATEQAEKDAALMYGEFNNTPSSQTLSLNAQVNLAHGERHAMATKTATPISVAAFDYTIAVDTATIAGASAVNLPAISAADTGRVYNIKDLTGSAATYNIVVNVAAGSGNLIDGASSQTINTAYGSMMIQSDGSNRWMIL